MTIDDRIRDEKVQFDINKQAAKTSALSSNKFNNYEYLTGEKILSSNQKQMIQQAKFTYSPPGKAFEKQIKAIQSQWQVKIIKIYEDSPLTLEAKEVFTELGNKRLN